MIKRSWKVRGMILLNRLMVVVLVYGVMAVPMGTVHAWYALEEFNRLVGEDRGLSDSEKKVWINFAEKQIAGQRFNFEYGRLLHGILSRAKFDEVPLNRGLRVANDCIKAVDMGAPEESVEEMALLAFAVDLSPLEIGQFARALEKCDRSGVPGDITQELIRHAKERRWSADAFGEVVAGLIEAAAHGADVKKIAIDIIVSMDKNRGAPREIVREALVEAQRRDPARWREEGHEIRVEAESPSHLPAVALDYDTFRRSVESFIGTRYVWGGTDRFGVDCSGFTKLVMQESGYRLPRRSQDQANVGSSVDRDNLRLGDLVFFDNRGKGVVDHVGIYLGGNIIVHASSAKGVTIVLFTDKYLQSRYLSARRIVTYRDR